MDEIFGRVTAILFAAAVFMGMPLLYMSERAKSAEQKTLYWSRETIPMRVFSLMKKIC